MKKIAALLPLALLSACASNQPSLQTERTYRVEWIGERPLIDRSYLTVTLGEDNRAYGNAGCNHWFGSYELDGQRLRFSNLGSTRKMCAEEIMEQEH